MDTPFEKLLVRLADHGVKFIVVGGVAVALQGYLRTTEDVDVLVEASRENVVRLLESLSDYGEGFSRGLSPDDFTDDEGAIRIVEEAEFCQIDIFTRMTGLYYHDLLPDSGVLDLGGRSVRYASKVSLIRLKSSSVREKDRLDVIALSRLAAQPPH
ncbi:MAG: nucleotidyltransferase [Verrucomicrobiota bacterium]